MNVRLKASFPALALSILLLVGCAGQPTTYYPEGGSPDATVLPDDIESLPQIALSGASRKEVRSLAMGAARSRGWAIGKSGPDRLVAQRPVDASTLPAYGGPESQSSIAPGSTLEITSYFLGQSGGMKVATRAEIVSPAGAGEEPTRIDYTDSMREPLTASLASLRDTWSRNRGRLAQATPPRSGWPDPWAGTPYARPASQQQQAPSEPTESRLAPSEASATAAAAPDVVDEPAGPDASATRSRPSVAYAEQPRVVDEADPDVRQTSLPTPSYTRPLPEPRRRPGAPVVDASSQLPEEGSAIPQGYRYETGPIDRRDNMMALPAAQAAPAPAAGSVTWAAYAEQYARQRGCQISAGGAQLIESRQDGEVHRVPCEGSDSFLVKCQNGTCQGLL